MIAKHPHDEFPTARISPDELAELRLLGRASFQRLPQLTELEFGDGAWDTIPIEIMTDLADGTPAFGTPIVEASAAPTVVMPRIRFTPPSCAIVLPQRSRVPYVIAIAAATVAALGTCMYLLV